MNANSGAWLSDLVSDRVGIIRDLSQINRGTAEPRRLQCSIERSLPISISEEPASKIEWGWARDLPRPMQWPELWGKR